VRKKVKLTYWNWADNPVHQSISIDSVNMFKQVAGFIEVEVDATMAVMESRKKLVTSVRRGRGPDVAMMVQYWAQDYYDNGILHPIEDTSTSGMRARTSCRTSSSRCLQAGQPILYLPQTSIPYFLFYRADWLAEAKQKVPDTYDEFITACRAISKPPSAMASRCAGRPTRPSR
jgi:ABC-type glycerol-3-phosphate transport system substrate-binding protein